MFKFFHDKSHNHTSQIRLLCEALYSYRNFHITESRAITRKKDDRNTIYKCSLKKRN